jgi:hypothetical protein
MLFREVLARVGSGRPMKLSIPIFLILIAIIGCKGQAAEPAVHKSLLLQFAKDQFPGYDVKGTSITEKDIDGDGYVSGTLTLQKPGSLTFRVIGVDVPLDGQTQP